MAWKGVRDIILVTNHPQDVSFLLLLFFFLLAAHTYGFSPKSGFKRTGYP